MAPSHRVATTKENRGMALDPKKLETLITKLQAEVTSLKRRCNLLEAERPTGLPTERFLWELRYRGSMSVDNVLIETLTKQEEEANALGQWYLDSLATPSVRFVRARRIVVARTVDVPAILSTWATMDIEPPVEASEDEMAPPVAEPVKTPLSPPSPETPLLGKPKQNGTSSPAGKNAAATSRAKVAVPKGTDPPFVPEGSRVQTHNTDPREEARRRVMDATRTGRVARIGD